MIAEHCRRCGLRIIGHDRRQLDKKYTTHVVEEHGMPAHVGELAR